MVYKLITPSTELPLTVADAKAQLNIEPAFTTDDALIESYIRAAGAYVEKIIQGPLMAQEWEALLTDFKACIELQKNNISAINSVKYYSSTNVDTTVNSSNYETDLSSVPARLMFISTYSAPVAYDRYDAVRVNFNAGYTNASAVPYDIRQALKLLVTHFYENRTPEIVGTTISKFALTIEKLLAAHMQWL